MNFDNIDPQLGQTLTQVINFKQQLTMLKSVDNTAILNAITEFANLIGDEMQKQAMGESTWRKDQSASSLQPNGL